MMKQGVIDFISLGCSKNLVDTERLMRQLEAVGWHCVPDSERPGGEIAVINTCGFIGDAKEESIQTILQFVERKKQKHLRLLVVMGCLSERYRADLEQEIPEVDAYFGKFDYMGLLEWLGSNSSNTDSSSVVHSYERKLTTPSHYAYLKISEGCNRMCSYCAIPLITGRHTSRPMVEILDEVQWLVSQGVKEFNIVAQDLSSYGLDLEGRHLLPELIDSMAQIDGVAWIRLHYTYPTDFPMDLLDVMVRHSNICKYMDIALQHCTDNMLGLMRRHITRSEQDALIRTLRERVPGICLRTTLLVGHPGETDEDFEELKQWVREMRFERMGCFAYSEEEGTYAQRHYEDDIPQEVKDKRAAELMAIQQEISGELMHGFIGKTLQVIIDRKDGEYYVGRTEFDSPDVDCEILIKSDIALALGSFYPVRITHADDFDLYATIEN